MAFTDRTYQLIANSDYISRDLSWLQFNYRVLDQARSTQRSITDRLKFIAITASNLDEFFMIRVGSLFNYLDYGKERVDYSGLREEPFKDLLLEEITKFTDEQNRYYKKELTPLFEKNGFRIAQLETLNREEVRQAERYFKKTIFPMLTPMVFDNYHVFPILMNQLLIFGVTTQSTEIENNQRKLSFVQIPKNLPRFFEIERDEETVFVPIEEIIRSQIHRLFRGVEIDDVTLFRITRNGDFTLEESDDLEVDFIEEMREKLKTRKTGRVVRLEIEKGYSKWMLRTLMERWELEEANVFTTSNLMDFTALWQIVGHNNFKGLQHKMPHSVPALAEQDATGQNIFERLKKRDILLHHPYNSIDTLLELLEKAAEDPNVLSIKLTIYRLADDSRITRALLRAAENGKHVSALFELKARFDEENNINEAQRLQRAGCFVIYGVSNLKTHTKLLLIVRKEGEKVTRYVHMSSGNYNEKTAKLYTDLGLLSTKEMYARDVSEFFNAITGHSYPDEYEQLLTAPDNMRRKLIQLVEQEAENARNGLESGICFKINSLQDRKLIDALYRASQAGVPVKLIVRGICCLRPGRKGLSENIEVCSIVGEYLEHSRLFYFHNNRTPKIYGGSADAMIRSFDRRIESLFLFLDERCKMEAINILAYNLQDNVNSYKMNEDGTYSKREPAEGEAAFNIHREFFHLTREITMNAKLF